MADIRITPNLPAAATPTPARTADAVRAAQRAFFDTALSNAASPKAARSVSAPSTTIAPVAPSPAIAVSASGQDLPTRPLRPGSLLDIRV